MSFRTELDMAHPKLASPAPPGVGFATLRAILKLWLIFSPENSGVFSAGNGPAMRSAIIGVCFGEYGEKLKNLVRSYTLRW